MNPEDKLRILIRNYRKEKGMSQSQLSSLARLNSKDNWSISRIETGIKRITLNDAVKIAKVLKINLDAL